MEEVLNSQEIISLAPEVIKSNGLLWIYGILILLVISKTILIINQKIEKEKYQSLIGIIIMPIMVWASVNWYFEYQDKIWLDITLVIAGITLGYFSYILDDLGVEVWNKRNLAIPLILGLAFGATWTLSAIFQEWQMLKGEIIEVASQHRTERYVWTYHQCSSTDSDGNTTYYDCPSYDYEEMEEKTDLGYDFPDMIEGEDYYRGSGYAMVQDRIDHLYYRAYLVGDGNESSWYLSWNSNLHLVKEKSKSLALNFYGEIIRDDGNSDKFFNGSIAPNLNEVKKLFPPGGSTAKVGNKFIQFFVKLWNDPFYKPLRKIYLMVYGFMGILLLFKQSREQALLFIISSLVFPLLILSVSMAKSGNRFTNMRFNRVKPKWMGYK